MRQEDISTFNESFERYRDRITNFSNEFEFGLFIHIARRSIPVILLITCLFGLGAYLYLRYTVPTFKASATLQLEKSDQASRILKVGSYLDENALSSEIELLRSGFLMKKTLKNLNLKAGVNYNLLLSLNRSAAAALSLWWPVPVCSLAKKTAKRQSLMSLW